MELEVGMYIRINGFVSKIGHINTSKKGNTYIQFKQPNGLLISMNTKYLDDEKISHNIIDLIEIGDYVNGYKIIKISTDHCGRTILIYGYDNGDRQVAITIYEEDIKSIVTKEQFKSMAYKVSE